MKASAVVHVSLALLASLATAATDETSLPAPADDSFYTPDPGFDTTQPGTILKSRSTDSIADSIRGRGVGVKDAHQLLYRTTDALGNAVAAVTTIVVPAQGNSSRVLSYHSAYDSDDNACAPSYSLAVNSKSSDADTIADILGYDITAAVPDYESVKGYYTVGPTSGQAVLDGIRAVLASSSITGVSSKANVASLGYSGGAIATEWAAELLNSYAPDVAPQYLGSAAGGVPANLTGALESLDGTAQANLIPRAMLGLAAQFPAFDSLLNAHYIPAKKAAFQTARKCGFTDVFANQKILQTYFDIGDALVQTAAWQDTINAAGIMGVHGRPTKPLYIFQGAKDEVVPVADVDALYHKYCDEGSVVQYVRNPNTNHGGEAGTGLPGAADFLINRFQGTPFITACSQTDSNS